MTAAGRVRWRLRLRDLAAASAFAAMAVSGSVPVWATAAFLLAFGLSMAGLRPLSGRAAWSVIVLMIAAMALFGSAIAGGLDLVIAACTFAALITGHRLIAAPSANTDNQVHLTSLLMISGGAALSGELLFGVCLTAFAAFSSLSLGMGVLEAATPEGDEVPVRPALRQIGLGVVAMLVGALVFFVLFPRLSWNVAARRPAPGLGVATTGFSDRVRLQGGGDIKSNPRAVLRARLGPDPSQSRLDAYWLGRTFDAFNGREWSGSGKPSTPKGQVRLAPLSGRTVRQEIELLPAYEARTLVALETPAVFSNAVAFTGAAPTRISLIEVPGEEVRVGQSSLGYRYQAFSVDGPQPLDEGGDLARYRALPKSIDPRVQALAARVVGDTTDPERAAQRLTAYLQRELKYTLELGEDVADPLAHFLFVRKEGHCEHFATALTVMLRTQGHAARVAAGFFGGERVGDEYVVRAGDAHAWTQVYVPGKGFVSFDATPESYRAARPQVLLAWLTQAYEAVDSFWRTRILDYSMYDQIDFARALVRPPKQRADRLPKLPPFRAWLVAFAVAGVIYGLWRWGRPWRGASAKHPASSMAAQLEKALVRAGAPLEEGEDLEARAQRWAQEQHGAASALGPAVRRYLEARFGGRPLDPEEQRRLVKPVEDALQSARR